MEILWSSPEEPKSKQACVYGMSERSQRLAGPSSVLHCDRTATRGSAVLTHCGDFLLQVLASTFNVGILQPLILGVTLGPTTPKAL